MTPAEILATTTSEQWMAAGMCAQADPETFYPTAGVNAGAALKVCRACPVIAECLQFAVENNETHGVWGGTTPVQRQALLNRTGKWRRVADHGTAARYRKHYRDGETPCEACADAYRVVRGSRAA